MPRRKNKNITRLVNRVNKSNADFVNRLKDANRISIPDWEDSKYTATHKLGVGTDENGQAFIFPNVQNINGELIDFTNPKFGKWDGMDSAVERGDTVHVDNIQDGIDFTENYKKYYPKGKSFKCGGRRKARLGLDIREGGIAQPIAPNMYYMIGRSHDDGGIAIGPNNKNGLEVEGGEVVKVGNKDIKVFSSVPLLRGVSPAQLVMGGANPNKVFKAQEDFKDRNCINDDGTTYEMGGEKENDNIAADAAKTIGGYLPFIGTAIDVYDLIKNPSWEQAGWTALGLLSDIFTGGSARAVFKTAKNLRNAKQTIGLVNNPLTRRLYRNAAQDAIKTYNRARIKVSRDAAMNVGQNYIQNKTQKMFGGEDEVDTNKKKSTQRPAMGPLPYGYTIHNLYDVENPNRKGLRGNIATMYDSRTLGAGVDVVSGHPDMLKRARAKKVTKKEADETAVTHLRHDDEVIRNNYADVYGKAAADTLSYGPRFLVAQARYQQGNVRKAWTDIHKAMAKGDAEALKRAVLKVTPKDHKHRIDWVNNFKVYKMGGLSRSEDYGSKKKPYPSVSKLDFAGGHRSYPIPTKADAVDVLKLASLHGRNDVKAKVYSKYPELRKKKEFGGNMIYAINGNVKNGLMNLRPKAMFGTRKKFALGGEDEKEEKFINKNTKIGTDGLIYTRAIDGDWHTDGTKYEDSKYYFGNTSAQQRSRKKVRAKQEPNILEEVTVVGKRPTRYAVSREGDVYDVSDYSGRISKSDGKTINIFDHPEEAVELLGYTPEIKTVGPGMYTIYNKHNDSTVYLDKVDKNKIIKTESIEGKKVNRPETKMIGSLLYEKNEEGRFVPAKHQPSKTVGLGITRHGVSHTNSNTIINPLTGEIIGEDNIVETETPSVKGKTRIGTQSAPRRGETQTAPVNRATAKVESPRPETPTNPMEARYRSTIRPEQQTSSIEGNEKQNEDIRIQNRIDRLRAERRAEQGEYGQGNKADEVRYTRAAGFARPAKETPSTGGQEETEFKERLIPQFNSTTTGDWIGLGANALGSIGSYLITKSAIDKLPEPVRPALYQAAKLKTTYDINPQLSDLREAERVGIEAIKRNTQSSNTSIAREQRLMNKTRNERNILYGQKENVETQLINQDRLNRQQVNAQNIATYNDYLNRITGTRQAQIQAKVSNINNFISGLTGGVNSILGTIENRRTTNNTLRAIAAANPNVDARLLGIGDYYTGEQTKKKYDKFGNLKN